MGPSQRRQIVTTGTQARAIEDKAMEDKAMENPPASLQGFAGSCGIGTPGRCLAFAAGKVEAARVGRIDRCRARRSETHGHDYAEMARVVDAHQQTW